MPHEAARNTIIRLACFAAIWLIVLAVHNVQRGDSNWMTKAAWLAVFAIPTVLLLFLLQRLARYRIPWFVEFVGMPFAIGSFVYAIVVIREFIGHLM